METKKIASVDANDHLDVTPNVNFLSTLRNSGYNNYAAIADIVDNSLDTNVNSNVINIWIKKTKEEFEHIKICDDGCGMDTATLKEAFKLGAITGKNREFDLGSYGTGLKAAALSIGKRFEVRTKSANDAFFIATYDLDLLTNLNSFKIPVRVGTEDEYKEFKEDTGCETGTVVILSKLDRISNQNKYIFADTLKSKLSSIYKYFIDEFNIKIFIEGKPVESYDPMLRNKPYTKCLTLNEKFEYGENEFKFSVFHVEAVSDAISKDISRNSANAGIYVYRNNRLVGSGLDLGIVNKQGDGYSNGVRIELFMDGDCDELFGSTFNKMIHEKDKNEVDQGFRDACRNVLSGYINTIKNNERSKKSTEKITEEKERENNEIFDEINRNKFIDIDKSRGINKKIDTPTPKPETKNVGRNKFSTRKRTDKFTDWRMVRLGENGVFFRPIKENRLYIIEINQDHPFWTKFLVNANFETSAVVNKLLVAMGISFDKTTYYDDAQKKELMDEYFLQISDSLRKLIIY